MRLSIWIAVLVGCGDPGATLVEPEAGSTGEAEASDPPANSTGSAPVSSEGTTAIPPEADTGSSESGDPPIELGPCERLAGCYSALNRPITPLLEAYGPAGTCWEQFAADECWQDCRALFEPELNECATVGACCQCAQDDDCVGWNEGTVCVSGICVAEDICGALAELCDPETSDFDRTCPGSGACVDERRTYAGCEVERGTPHRACSPDFDSDPACADEHRVMQDCIIDDVGPCAYARQVCPAPDNFGACGITPACRAANDAYAECELALGGDQLCGFITRPSFDCVAAHEDLIAACNR